jgi:capsular polysaccharide transport system permease protein
MTPAKSTGWLQAARKAVNARRTGQALTQLGADLKGKLPALSEGVDRLSETLSTFGGGSGWVRMSFLVGVVAPSVVFALYTALWQTDRYVAETRLTVRAAPKQETSSQKGGGAEMAASMMARMTGAGASNDTQNSYIVQNYIRSRAVIVDLGGRPYMEKKFSGAGVDYFSRLARDARLEDLWKFWQEHVFATVDTLSGILSVRVDAFEPRDALDIANDLLALSEKLVNSISVRNRTDTLSRAEDEVKVTRQKLAEAKEKVLEFRNKSLTIDPASSALSINEILMKLSIERIEMANSLTTNATSLSSDSPGQRILRTRIAAIDQQIAELKRKLTDDKGATDAVATQIASFERVKLEEQFAEKIYTIAQTAYDTARQDLLRQQLFLVTVVPPTLPESPTYPRVIANIALFSFALTLVWAITALIAASVEEQLS